MQLVKVMQTAAFLTEQTWRGVINTWNMELNGWQSLEKFLHRKNLLRILLEFRLSYLCTSLVGSKALPLFPQGSPDHYVCF